MNTNRHEAPTTLLRSLFQHLTTLTVKRFSLMCSLNLPWHSCVLLLHMLPSVMRKKRPAPPCPLPSSWSHREQWVACSLPLLQTRWPKHPQPLLTGHGFSHFTSFVALLWMLSRTLISFLDCGAQNCTQYCIQITDKMMNRTVPRASGPGNPLRHPLGPCVPHTLLSTKPSATTAVRGELV